MNNIIFGHNIKEINDIFATITDKINENYKKKNMFNFNDYYYNYEEEINVINDLILHKNNICLFVSVIKSTLNKYVNINRGCDILLQNYIKMNNQLEFLNYELGRINYYYCKNNFDELDNCLMKICVKLLQKVNINHFNYIYNFLYLSV